MSAGRPVTGPELVDDLDGSEAAKQRVKVILETVAGQRTIMEACIDLKIGKSAFHELRKRVLQAALSDAEPRPVGRPPKLEPTAEQTEAEHLRAENQDLRDELELAQVRQEILLTMPEVFQQGDDKKNDPSDPPRRKPKGGRRRRRRAWNNSSASTSRCWSGRCGSESRSGVEARRRSRSGGRSSGW
jgi:hypothetical protein